MRIIKMFLVLLFLGFSFIYLNYFSSFVMPWDREEAIEAALSWGKLDKLPKDADITNMEKRGSIFTRQFIIEFTSSKSEIKNWILKSKGFKGVEPEIKDGTKIYEIHPKDLESYGGRVKIKGNTVYINMSWS
ncbi:hypothetical protein J2Y38_002444 [Flavobacterium sp. 2755]|uniref:hypothetical protein n=1 Tax=Flavobacterium sp. 2755 TaxID=2817765 RepID=UPI00285B8AD4|nr:hypothetical protein [Flavobacterium sp. 2755]MDR6762233.1 hypothetical protein [Flavobacterium sp. 2755]